MKQFFTDSLSSSTRLGSREKGSSSRPNTTPITSIRLVSTKGPSSLSTSSIAQLVPLGAPSSSLSTRHEDFLCEELDEDGVLVAEIDTPRAKPSVEFAGMERRQSSGAISGTSEEHYTHDFIDEEITPVKPLQPVSVASPAAVPRRDAGAVAGRQPKIAPTRVGKKKTPAGGGQPKPRPVSDKRPVTAPDAAPEPATPTHAQPTKDKMIAKNKTEVVAASTNSTGPSPNLPDRPLRMKISHRAVIGKGSFGVVYQAMDLDTNHIVACKEICLVKGGDDQTEQIQKEFSLLKQLDHPNIVKCYGEQCDDKFLRIYMEYVTGGSISSIIRMFGALQEKQASVFTQQMLQGLAYLHDRQICHRDLKGDNLLVDTRGVLKLADFGTARQLVSQANTIAGTAYFMAPEVIQGVGHGVEADVWSVGCCVIEMVTGKPPFSHFKNQYAIMMHVAENSRSLDDTIPKGVSDACTSFLKRCLVRAPKERATVAELLKHKWITDPPEFQTEAEGHDLLGSRRTTGMLDTSSIQLAGQQTVREAQESLLREEQKLRSTNVHRTNNGAPHGAVHSFNPMDMGDDENDAFTAS